MDEPYCTGTCLCSGGRPEASFGSRCALYPLLDKLRRWSAFPEEVEKG
jgi:hypothetical protein